MFLKRTKKICQTTTTTTNFKSQQTLLNKFRIRNARLFRFTKRNERTKQRKNSTETNTMYTQITKRTKQRRTQQKQTQRANERTNERNKGRTQQKQTHKRTKQRKTTTDHFDSTLQLIAFVPACAYSTVKILSNSKSFFFCF